MRRHEGVQALLGPGQRHALVAQDELRRKAAQRMSKERLHGAGLEVEDEHDPLFHVLVWGRLQSMAGFEGEHAQRRARRIDSVPLTVTPEGPAHAVPSVARHPEALPVQAGPDVAWQRDRPQADVNERVGGRRAMPQHTSRHFKRQA